MYVGGLLMAISMQRAVVVLCVHCLLECVLEDVLEGVLEGVWVGC